MVAKKTAGKKSVGKLKIRKETVRNLDAKRGAAGVKGGVVSTKACVMSGTTCYKKGGF